MNVKLSLPRLGLISNTVSHGAKFLAGLVVFCVIMNGLIPRFVIGAEDYEVLSQIMQQQSTLLRFFSFSTLPVKLVDDLFAGNLPHETRNNAPKHQDTNAANTSSDFSFISFDKKTSNRLGIAQRIGVTAAMIADAGASAITGAAKQAAKSSPGERSALLALLLLFLMLPRSSISDGPASFSFARNTYTQLVKTSWVFYLSFTRRKRGSV